MEFTRRSPDPPSRPPHGDSMMVIRDALLSQLQKDRLRQEIIVAELAQIECAMALRSAAADAERAKPAPFDFDEQFMTHGTGTVGPERHVGVGKANDLKKEDGVRRRKGKQSKERHVTEDGFVSESSKASSSTCKAAGAQKNLARDDEGKPQESSEAKKSPSMKWSCAICHVEGQVQATSEGNLLQHFAGQKHRINVIALKAIARAEKSRKARQYAGKPGPTWVCKFCPANCTGKSVLENHLKGKKHHAKIQAHLEECKSMTQDRASAEADSNPNMVTQDEGKPDSVLICGICQVKCASASVKESHVRGKKHQMNLQALQLEAKRLGIIPPKVANNQQAPPEWDCTICQAKCNSESRFHDNCRSMGHQQKVDTLQREGTNTHSSGLEAGKKLQTDGSNSNDASLEGEPQKALYFCKLCNLQCNSKNTLGEHRRGKKHLEKVEKRMLSSFCGVCNLQCNSEKMLAHHCAGSKHQANRHGWGC